MPPDQAPVVEAAVAAPAEVPAYAVFRAVLAAADADGLHVVPIRPRTLDQATALSGGDYDLLLPEAEHAAFVKLLARHACAAAVSFTIDHTVPAKRRVELHAPEVNGGIVLELWTRLEVSDPAKATARAIPWPALHQRLERDGAGWRLPHDVAALYYLSHLATKGKDVRVAEVRARLEHYRAALTASDVDLAGLLGEALAGGDLTAIASEANQRLVARGVLHAANGAMDRLRVAAVAARDRRARRRRRAILRGRIYAVTGPDGVGKTTVIDALRGDSATRLRAYRFKSLFRHNPFYSLLHALRFKALAKQLGGELAKNRFDDLHGPTLFRFARWWHPTLRLKALVKGRQCCDRYFHDLLFTDLRGGEKPRLVEQWRSLAPRMPLPAWHLHLDASNEVIHSRKRELTTEALDAYRAGMIDLQVLVDTPLFTWLNTGRPLDQVRATLRLAAKPLGLRFR